MFWSMATEVSKRLRAGIVVGIIKRLHRRLQQNFVALRAARADRGALDVGAVGHEGQRHGTGQAIDRLLGQIGADAETRDDDSDPRAALFWLPRH